MTDNNTKRFSLALPIPDANYKWTISIGDLTEEGFTEFAAFYDHVRESVTNLFPQANYKVSIVAFSLQSKSRAKILSSESELNS